MNEIQSLPVYQIPEDQFCLSWFQFGFGTHYGEYFLPFSAFAAGDFRKLMAFATVVLKQVVALLKFSQGRSSDFINVGFGWDIQLRGTGYGSQEQGSQQYFFHGYGFGCLKVMLFITFILTQGTGLCFARQKKTCRTNRQVFEDIN
jgi:hypothetical protein